MKRFLPSIIMAIALIFSSISLVANSLPADSTEKDQTLYTMVTPLFNDLPDQH